MTVRITERGAEISYLEVDDVFIRDLLRSQPAERWDEITARALGVGARGVLTMGLGLDLAELESTVQGSVEAVLDKAQAQVGEMLASASEAFAEQLDPDRASSILSRALAQLGEWRESFLASVDPAQNGSHTARFVDEINALVGRGGALESWLSVALDPHADDTALGRMAGAIRSRLDELSELVIEERGRKTEAGRGTRKGFDFEDVVEERVRATARHIGAIVERTSRKSGELGLVGDLTMTLPDGSMLVFEVKDQARIALTGRDGILDELDRAMTNRRAEFAVCVSAQDAYPAEVGGFASYGNKLLLTESGDGMMVDVAVRWAAASLGARSANRGHGLDPATIAGKLHEIRSLAQLFSSNRRSLTDIGRSIESVRGSLGDMRARLIALTEELLGDLGAPQASAELVELHPAESI